MEPSKKQYLLKDAFIQGFGLLISPFALIYLLIRNARRVTRAIPRSIIYLGYLEQKKFMELQTIDRTTKRKLYYSAKYYNYRYAKLFTPTLMYMVSGIYLLEVFRKVVTLVFYLWASTFVFENNKVQIILPFLVYAVVFWIISEYLGKNVDRSIMAMKLKRIWIAFICLFLLIYLILVLNSMNGKGFLDAILIGFLTGLSSYLFFLISEILYLSIVVRILLMKLYFHPSLTLIYRLLNLLGKLEDHPRQWKDFSFRREVILDLEIIAANIDRLTRLVSSDITTDIWFDEVNSSIAGGFRDLKKWVLVPKEDTREFLLKELSNSVVHILSGNWDSLRKVKPVHPKTRILLRTHLLLTSRKLIIGSGPLVMLLIVAQIPGFLEVQFRDYAIFGAIVWMFISFLVDFDPYFYDKLSALRETTQFLKDKI